MANNFEQQVQAEEELRVKVSDVMRVDGKWEDVNNKYSSWASAYDQDFSHEFANYAAPKLMANVVKSRVNPSARILDVGAGTGLVGQQLRSQGLTNIDAVDANEAMLERANEKGVYKNIFCARLGPTPTQIPQNSYDVAVIVSALAPGHMGTDCFEEIIRILKPGGLFIFSIGEKGVQLMREKGDDVDARVLQLASSGQWKLLDKEPLDGYYLGVKANAYVLQITKT